MNESAAPEALGQSEAFIEFQERISKVAPIDRPVLILGERGTGKELAASRIHFLSKRWHKPFVTLNCSALSPALIDSELFGHEKGAFTGASASRSGRFEKASEGTLFLDEMGSIPIDVQEKILRVVEYKRFERVGASDSIFTDVRIVAATNADLASMADEGRFKRDLLDRLSFEVIHVPPLRYRKEDIMLLASHFAGRMSFELGRKDIPTFSFKAVKALESHPWPGNIRELKNVVERAVYRSDANKIEAVSFDPFQSPWDTAVENKTGKSDSRQDSDLKDKRTARGFSDPVDMERSDSPSFKKAVAELEKYLVSSALEKSRYNQKKAAVYLDLTYDQFRGLLKKYSKSLNV